MSILNESFNEEIASAIALNRKPYIRLNNSKRHERCEFEIISE